MKENNNLENIQKSSTHLTERISDIRNKHSMAKKEEKNLDYHIYPTPPSGQDMTQGQFLSGV